MGGDRFGQRRFGGLLRRAVALVDLAPVAALSAADRDAPCPRAFRAGSRGGPFWRSVHSSPGRSGALYRRPFLSTAQRCRLGNTEPFVHPPWGRVMDLLRPAAYGQEPGRG